MEILSPLQNNILSLLDKFSDNDKNAFYFTGGTALAFFYLKHRKSNDLDFFADTEHLITPFSQKTEELLKREKLKVERRRGFQSLVELFVESGNDTTIIHLALDSPFRIEPTTSFKEFPTLRVDNLTDLAANKLLALFSRATLRDFIDVYFLATKWIDKKTLIKNAQTKDPGFDLYWLGVALERIEGFSDDSPEMLLLLERCPISKIKDFFNKWRQEIREQIV